MPHERIFTRYLVVTVRFAIFHGMQIPLVLLALLSHSFVCAHPNEICKKRCCAFFCKWLKVNVFLQTLDQLKKDINSIMDFSCIFCLQIPKLVSKPMAIHRQRKKICLCIGDEQTNNHLYRLPRKKIAKNLLEKNKELSI